MSYNNGVLAVVCLQVCVTVVFRGECWWLCVSTQFCVDGCVSRHNGERSGCA